MSSIQLCTDYNDSDIGIYNTFCDVAGVLSFITSSTVTASYAFLPNLRKKQNFRYIGYLSFANILMIISLFTLDISDLQHNVEESNTEMIDEILNNYSQIAVNAWAIIFTFNVYNIIDNKSVHWVTNEKLCLFIGFILPLPLVLLQWWIQAKCEWGVFASSVNGVVLIILLVMYARIAHKARNIMQYDSANRLMLQVIGYSIVLTINLICDMVGITISQMKGCVSMSYFWLHFVWYLQGFADAVVYGMNPVFRQELWARLSRKEKRREESMLDSGIETTSMSG